MPNLCYLNVNQNHIIAIPEQTETLRNIQAEAQRIYVTVEEKQSKIDLNQYPLLKKALADGTSVYFSQENYKITNCTLSSDKRCLAVTKGSTEAELMLYKGRAAQTKLFLTVQKSDIANSKVSGLKFTSKTNSITLKWKAVSGAAGYQVYQYDKTSKKWKKKATVTTNQATLTWKKISGASGYKIYMASKKDGTYKLIQTVKKGSTISYNKTKLTTGKTYYFNIFQARIPLPL